jgi:magnesium chelatase subunit D
MAARLVLAPRATMVPEEAPEPEPPAPDDAPEESSHEEQTGRLADSVLEAARAALPADLLAGLARGVAMRARAGGSAGAVRRNAQRGRTVGVRLGEPRGGARLHLLATLMAAAPWQKLRGAVVGRIAVRRSDFRLRRFHQATRTTTIFVVDASGSAAVHRLAEAKGAVELLLAECYVRRDRVALLSMRGAGAEVLLPQTPVGVFLTDGRPNVALDGGHGRPGAEADALTVARAWRASGHAALLVDMAVRPHPFARGLAEAAGARYLALPSAGSGVLEAAVRGAVAG